MPNTIYHDIKPTYLYIKIHSITGMRYFGKTINDPKTYHGSGVYWRKHIKKYGIGHVATELILGPYANKSELMALALYMSEELNVVNSNGWANLTPENGINGGRAKGFVQTGNAAKGVPNVGGKAKGVPATGKLAKGLSRAPATGKKSKGMPATGKAAKGSIATGKNAKGVPKTGRRAKGVPNTGGSAKGVPKTGRAARGLSRAPGTGRNAKGVPKGPAKGGNVKGHKQPILICPHCGKLGGKSNMMRWHFDKCKMKPSHSLANSLHPA